MALTIAEATAVNALCNFLCRPSMRLTLPSEARNGLALLAEHANKSLMAGFDRQLVQERWSDAGVVEGLEKFAAELGEFCDTNDSEYEVALHWDGTSYLMKCENDAAAEVATFATLAELWEYISGAKQVTK